MARDSFLRVTAAPPMVFVPLATVLKGHGIRCDTLSLPKVLPYIKSYVYNLFTGLTSVYI